MHVSRPGRLFLAGLTVLSLLSACGEQSSAAPTPTPPYPVQDPHAVSGGTLTIGVWQPQPSFLNAGVIDSRPFAYAIDAPVAEGLLWYRSPDRTANAKSPADYYQPWLATEIPTVANHDVQTSGCPNLQAAMCVTWKLRTGVQWHDGSSFTSADVCDTYNLYWLTYQAQNPTPVLNRYPWSETMDCKPQGDNTVVVEYKHPVGAYLSLGAGVMGILPAAELDPALATGKNIESYAPNVDLTQGSHNTQAYSGSTLTMDQMLDGTGPYVFKSADTHDIVYVKNDNYWNKAHQPHVDRLVFKLESDQPAELRDAQSGAIDVGLDLGLNNYSAVKSQATGKRANFEYEPILGSGAEKVDINICANTIASGALCGPQAAVSPYTADGVIRKAILEGINRPAIVQREVHGVSATPRDSWMYLGAAWIDSKLIPQTAYNPEGARNALDAAGYHVNTACTDAAGHQYRAFKDGTCIAVNLGTTGGNGTRTVVEAMIQSDLQKIGIEVNSPFTPNEAPGVFFGSFADGGPLYTHKFDLAMYDRTLGSPGEPDSLYRFYHGACNGSCANAATTSPLVTGVNGIGSPSNPTGLNDTGLNDPSVDAALDAARTAIDPVRRADDYVRAERALARDIVEVPLYQKVTINTFTTKIRGVLPNDFAWTYNSYDWYCAGGNCQA